MTEQPALTNMHPERRPVGQEETQPGLPHEENYLVFSPVSLERVALEGKEFAGVFTEKMSFVQRVGYVASRAMRLGVDHEQELFYSFLKAAQEDPQFTEQALDATAEVIADFGRELLDRQKTGEPLVNEDLTLTRGIGSMINQFPIDTASMHEGLHSGVNTILGAIAISEGSTNLNQEIRRGFDRIRQGLHPIHLGSTNPGGAERLSLADTILLGTVCDLLSKKGYRIYTQQQANLAGPSSFADIYGNAKAAGALKKIEGSKEYENLRQAVSADMTEKVNWQDKTPRTVVSTDMAQAQLEAAMEGILK